MNVFNLKEIEKKAYRSTFQDGIWDIFLGGQLLILAAGVLLSNTGLEEVWIMTALVLMQVMILLVFIFGKKRITVPRMGVVKFGPKRKSKLRKSRIILFCSVILGLVFFLIGAMIIRSYPAGRLKLLLVLPAAWIVNCIVVFSFLAYYLDCTRFYAYGLLFALPIPIGMLVKDLIGVNIVHIAFAFSAILILAVGTMLLVRFLREYPLTAREMSVVERN
jgi:hypothetical protein